MHLPEDCNDSVHCSFFGEHFKTKQKAYDTIGPCSNSHIFFNIPI